MLVTLKEIEKIAEAKKIAVGAFNGTNSTFSVRLNGAIIFGLSVAATAPEVRP